MAGPKVLGIDQISLKIIYESIITLALFSFATSGVFELWKLFPTVFTGDRARPDWWSWFVCIFPVALFLLWFNRIYRRYKPYIGSKGETVPKKPITPHSGIVLVLSNPKIRVEEINAQIVQRCQEDNVEALFQIWGIGHLLKGLYHHRDALRHIWLIETKESQKFEPCIALFLKYFMPGAAIVKPLDTQARLVLTGMSDLENIESVKNMLSRIYASENLENFGLVKSDIIVDVTGGPKPVTIGMIFGALDSLIDIQYVEQSSGHYEIIPLQINHELILDKTAEYLSSLYAKQNLNKGTIR